MGISAAFAAGVIASTHRATSGILLQKASMKGCTITVSANRVPKFIFLHVFYRWSV